RQNVGSTVPPATGRDEPKAAEPCTSLVRVFKDGRCHPTRPRLIFAPWLAAGIGNLSSRTSRSDSSCGRATGRRRVHLRRRDRLFWVVLASTWRRWRTALVLVLPAAVLRWHRECL